MIGHRRRKQQAMSLVELLVATTILAIVALAAGGIFGKFYSLFGKNAETIRAIRIANELLGRYQTRWSQDFGNVPDDCPLSTSSSIGSFCYQIDLFRDTKLGGNPQAGATISSQTMQLSGYTAWMDVSTVKRKDFTTAVTSESDWLLAKTVRIRIYRAGDIYCSNVAQFRDSLGLPTTLHFPDSVIFTGDYFTNVAGGVRSTYVNNCFSQGLSGERALAANLVPNPLAEASSVVVVNPRNLTNRRGTEYVSFYRDANSNFGLHKLQPVTPENASAQINYYDSTLGPTSMDLYQVGYPGIQYVPPTGWVPDPVSGAMTFNPSADNADPVIRFILWTFAGPDANTSASTLDTLPQFRHRLGITTFTDRIVYSGATSGFLNTGSTTSTMAVIPQANGQPTDNYIPLWISVTSLPDAAGLCTDELAPPSSAKTDACDAPNNFTRIVLPTFPSAGASQQSSPYEASVNIPPGPPFSLAPTVGGLPGIYGLFGTIRSTSYETIPWVRQLGSRKITRFGRPHLVHIALPQPLLASWPATGTPINLSIARVRFQS